MKKNNIYEVITETKKNLILQSGAKDIIFIDFDSLFLTLLRHHCPSCGINYVTFIYLFEKLVVKFIRRGLKINFFMFKSFVKAYKSNYNKLGLREVIIKHIKENVVGKEVELYVFEKMDKKFKQFIDDKHPYIAFVNVEKNGGFTEMDELMYYLLKKQIDVVTMDSISFTSSSLTGFVWELREEGEIIFKPKKRKKKKDIVGEGIFQKSTFKSIERRDDNECLVVKLFGVACMNLFNQDEKNWDLIQLLLFSLKQQQYLCFSERELDLTEYVKDFKNDLQVCNKFLNKLSLLIFNLFHYYDNNELCKLLNEKKINFKELISSFIDCRLFFIHYILYKNGRLSVNKITLSKYFSYQKKLGKKQKSKYDFYGKRKNDKIDNSLLKIDHVIIDQIIPNYKKIGIKDLDEKIGNKSKEFQDKYHWSILQKLGTETSLAKTRKVFHIQKYAQALGNESKTIELAENKKLIDREWNIVPTKKKRGKGYQKYKQKNRKKTKTKKEIIIDNNNSSSTEILKDCMADLVQINLNNVKTLDNEKTMIKIINSCIRRGLGIYFSDPDYSIKVKGNKKVNIINFVYKFMLKKMLVLNVIKSKKNDFRIFQTILLILKIVINKSKKNIFKTTKDLMDFFQSDVCKNSLNSKDYIVMIELLKNLAVTRSNFFQTENITYHLKFLEKYQDIEDYEIIKSCEDFWNVEDYTKYKKTIGFIPDEWQKELIKYIQEKRSVVVSTPTSSGKTFLALLAMEKVIRESDTDVVVFISPTIALVNQVAAECMSRFNKQYKRTDREIVGVCTRYDRYHVYDCQILVTVPIMLHILFLSSSEQNMKWREKIKYVIFDEVHKINDYDGGDVLEQLLLMIECPFLALSATIGNPQVIVDWLNIPKGENEKHQKDKRKEVKLIEYYERTRDIKYHMMNTDGDDYRLLEIHSYSFLNDNCFDINLIEHEIMCVKQSTPSQLIRIYEIFKECKIEKINKLSPLRYFSSYSMKFIPFEKIKNYEKDIRKRLISIAKKDLKKYHLIIQKIRGDSYSKIITTKKEEDYEKGIWQLIMKMKEANMFPSLCFLFSRRGCEESAMNLLKYLEDNDEHLFSSVSEREGYLSIVGDKIDDLRKEDRNIDEFFFDTLKHGIGIHHAGISKYYRSEIEGLFRKKLLKVIICTGTLALGIDMPARSVSFFGDSIYLSSSLFNQCSGRAGRRSYDLIGHVFFYGFSKERMRRLMISENDKILGSFGFKSSTVLRVMISLANPKFINTVKKLVGSPLSSLDQGMEITKSQIKNQIRFSLEFLMMEGYIDQKGVPIDFAGLASHLFYCEPSNFIFILFLKHGLFHNILKEYDTQNIEKNVEKKNELIRKIMQIVCYLFTDSVKSSTTEDNLTLNQLNEDFLKVLDQYEDNMKNLFFKFVCNLGNTITTEEEGVLPFSKIKVGNDNDKKENSDISKSLSNFIESNKLKSFSSCSKFVRLEGLNEKKIFENSKNIEILNESLRMNINIDLSLLPISLKTIRRYKVSSVIYDFFFKSNIKHTAEKHFMSTQELEKKLRSFFKIIRKISTSLVLLGPENDYIVSIFKHISDKFQKKLWIKQYRGRYFKSRPRVRVNKYGEEVGDLSGLNTNVPDEFFRKKKSGKKIYGEKASIAIGHLADKKRDEYDRKKINKRNRRINE